MPVRKHTSTLDLSSERFIDGLPLTEVEHLELDLEFARDSCPPSELLTHFLAATEVHLAKYL